MMRWSCFDFWVCILGDGLGLIFTCIEFGGGVAFIWHLVMELLWRLYLVNGWMVGGWQ